MGAVTREEVARAAGVSPAAVSLALRGRSGVSEATRERVCRVAERLGYRISSAASVLAQQRVRGKVPARLAVALLGGAGSLGAEFVEVAEARGLEAHSICPGELAATPEASSRILWARGIAGLLLARNLSLFPGEEAGRFGWERFSVVKLGRARPELRFRLVRHSPFDYLAMGLEEVFRRGYRRVAVLLHRTASERDDLARLGALLAFREWKLPAGAVCEWCEIGMAPLQGGIPQSVIRWLNSYRPDAVLAPATHAYPQLRAAGVIVPGRTGFAGFLIPGAQPSELPVISGVSTRPEELMGRAVGLLYEMLVRNERGFANEPSESVIEPVWIEGETLPSVQKPPG